MPQFAPQEVLKAAEKATPSDVKAWKRGVYLESRSHRLIDDLRVRVVVNRLDLAADLRRRGTKLMKAQPAQNRDATSRFYYSMYHSMRAVVAFMDKGDEELSHSKLPEATPGDFPNRDTWINRLKDARVLRNEADYNVYPISEGAWRSSAVDLGPKASELYRVCVSYLRQKGCTGL